MIQGVVLERWDCHREFSIFDLYLKLAIGNIGNGNTITLATLAIRSNPVGDTKKGEAASCLFQRDKSGVVERGCAGAADVGGKFIEGESIGSESDQGD